MPFPLVSVISVNYNAKEDTLAMLHTLEHSNYKNCEIIVVDNASQYNPCEEINEKYPNVITLRSDKNLGFAGGNNLGISKAKGQLIFLLNNDTEVPSDAIAVLVQSFEDHPEMGAVSPKLKYFSEPNKIQFAGFSPMSKLTGRNYTLGFGEQDQGQYDVFNFTPYGHGAAFMFHRDILEKVGSMSELFFLYYEELDWSARITKGGYKIGYEPRAEIIHKESASVGQGSPLKIYYLSRNRILFMRRNYSFGSLVAFYLFLTFITIPKNTLKYLFSGRLDLLKAFCNGVIWNLKNPAHENRN